MSTSHKRKFSEHDSQNACNKKFKTKEILCKGISSPQEKNIAFPTKCSSIIGGTRDQTPSVAYFFKKTKISSQQKLSEDKICMVDEVFESRNSRKKFNEDGLSETTPRNIRDISLSMNTALYRQNNWGKDTVYLEETSKCKLFPSTHKWPDLNCSILPKKEPTVSNIVKDKVVISDEMFSSQVVENTHHSIDQSILESNSIETKTVNKRNLGEICGSTSSQKISSIKLQQPERESSVKQISKTLYPKKNNYSLLNQDKSMLPANEYVENKLFNMKSDSSITNIKHRVTGKGVSQENQYLENTREFHSMYYSLFQNIQKSPFPFIPPIKEQIDTRKSVDVADISKQYTVQKNNNLRETKDFHSMYSTLSLNISSPYIFPIEGRTKAIKKKPPGKYLANCFKGHTKKSLNYSESQAAVKKMSSFENFVENLAHASKNGNSVPINFSDSILPYENKNPSLKENAIVDLKSNVPETNDEALIGDSAKLVVNIDKLNLSDIQEKTKSLKNTSKTVEELKIPEGNSIRNTGSFSKKQSLNNLNKITTKKYLNMCTNKRSIPKTKITIRSRNYPLPRLNSEKSARINDKSCIITSFGKNKTNFAYESTMKSNMNNQFAHSFDSITTDLTNSQYNNGKSTQSNPYFRRDLEKCELKQKSSITSDIKKSIHSSQKVEVNKKNYPIQDYQDRLIIFSPQNIKYDKFHSNLIKSSIDTESNDRNNFEKKKFSPIKTSVLHKVANRKFVNPFKVNISEDSYNTSPILMTESVNNIENRTTYNEKNESTNMSKTHVRNNISIDEQDKQQTETENSSDQYISSDKQVNIKLNNSRFNLLRSDVGGICNKKTKIECCPLNNNEIYRNSSRLENSVNNIVQQNLAATVDKLRHSGSTQILASEEMVQSSSNTGNKDFDFVITTQDISHEIPILNNFEKLDIDSVKNISRLSNLKNSSLSENIEQILQIPEGDSCKKKSNGVRKCNFKFDSSLPINFDETNKEIDIHNETRCFTKSRDIVFSKNMSSVNIPVDHSFSQHEYDLLKKISSPLLSDVECRNYLKSVVNNTIAEKTSNSSNVSVLDDHHTDSEQQSSFIGLKEMENKTNIEKQLHFHADSQEKNLHQFWDNISLQNDFINFAEENPSQNIASGKRSFFTQNFNAVNEKLSQESETELLNHILSQNFTESDSLLGGVLKNMNNLSQKSMKQRHSLHNFNQNSNKLLELALIMYKQFKTNVILSNKEKVLFTQSIRSQIEVEQDGSTKIYRLKENPSDDLIILDINSNSNCSECENYNYFNITTNETDGKILQGLYKIYQNKTFLYEKEHDGSYSRQNKISIINKIEKIFEGVLEKLAANKSPELRIRRQTFEDCFFDRKRLMFKVVDNPRIIKIQYKNVLSQPKFCLIMFVLAKSLDLLKNNTKLTKREIYYQIKSLVSDQGKINSAIKAVSCMLCVGPWDLNIIAHKGMVFGDLKIKLSSNEIINCNVPGTLIPNDIDDFVELKSSAYFILVVEKESIYYKLLEEDLPNRLVKSFIMITGKGFPDLNTQIFLRKLWMVMSLPIFILTDADPHGVNIMITYRFGSLANVHISDQLSVPKAKWLGVFPSEITKFDAEKQPLTDNEKFVIKNILKTPYMTDNPRIEAELKIMLELGYKAGIEGIIKNDTFLSEFYFPMKFYNLDLI